VTLFVLYEITDFEIIIVKQFKTKTSAGYDDIPVDVNIKFTSYLYVTRSLNCATRGANRTGKLAIE